MADLPILFSSAMVCALRAGTKTQAGAILTLVLVLLAGAARADIYVIDGDTIVVDREHIRILDIDTPEIRHAQCDLELKRGLEAKAFLLTMIVEACGPLGRAPAACLDIDRLPKPDRYGRTLAKVGIAGRDIAATMLGAGHARSYVCPNGRCPKRKPWCEGGSG